MLVETMVLGGILAVDRLGALGYGIFKNKKLEERLDEMEKKFVTKEDFDKSMNGFAGKMDELLNVVKTVAQTAQPQAQPAQPTTQAK